MANWSSRRKSRIAITILILVVAAVTAIYFLAFYKTPTCFDGIRNGNETGTDCGGSCRRLCQSAYIPAQISWGGGKFEKIADGLYNVAAYVVNPNTNAAATNVPYKFTLFDNRGILIEEREGRMVIPAHRNVLVFEPAIQTGERIPTKVTFEFTRPPLWFKSHDTLQNLSIVDKKYSEDAKSSSLQVILENKGLTPINKIAVGAVLFDIDGNAIGFSQTLLDSLPPKGKDLAPFTWPVSRQGKVVTIEALPLVAPLHD
jgi:hypothetical protein